MAPINDRVGRSWVVDRRSIEMRTRVVSPEVDGYTERAGASGTVNVTLTFFAAPGAPPIDLTKLVAVIDRAVAEIE